MGSLFQLRDYWYASFTGEEFSPSAITLVDPDVSTLLDKIAIGSFQGVLRILSPSAEQGLMLPGDVLLEKQYDDPILQLECVPFRPFQAQSSTNLLAVLFPRTLMFLEITARGDESGDYNATMVHNTLHRASSGGAAGDLGGGDAHSSTTDAAAHHQHRSKSSVEKDESPKELNTFYTLTVHGKLHLDHTSYNFASGSFGRVEYNMVCVQSMDGLLTIADHNSILYRSFFPPNQFLLPGPLTYCASRDTLLTCNSSMFLLCYSFSSIVKNTIVAGDNEHGAAALSYNAEMAAARSSNLRPLWSFNLGEDAVDIAVCRLTRGLPREHANIVVLCSTTLYIFNETGVPHTIRHLDVEAASLCVYPLPAILYDNLLVGTSNGLVQVYSDTELEWSAAVPSGAAPLNLSVATLCGVEGMIINMSADSTLTVNYLGTDPVNHRPQTLDNKSSSYAEIMTTLKDTEKLIQVFAETTGEDDDAMAAAENAVSTTTPEKALVDVSPTRAAPPPQTTPPQVLANPEKSLPTAELSLSSTFGPVDPAENTAVFTITLHTFGSGVDDVSVVAEAVTPLLVTPAQHLIADISAGGTAQVAFTVGAVQDNDLIIPSSLEVVVVAVYRGRRRQYQTLQHVALAPLLLVSRPVPPVKNTAFSVQINTNKSPPPSLMELFPDMAAYSHVAPNVLSLHYLNGADVTVLVSKNAARFKLQSSTMEGLWLLASEVARRVRAYYADTDLLLETPDAVPLTEFLAVVDTHWAIRKEVVVARAGLDQAADLFRAVEKRLLARFRDRSPADATALAVLFQESYKYLQERTDAVVTARQRLRQASAMLSCCAQLTWMCVEMAAPHMSSEDAATLRTLFRCSIGDSNDVGWEEVTEAVLAKMLDIKTKRVTSTVLELAANTVNVKAYVRKLVESMKSGQRLSTN